MGEQDRFRLLHEFILKEEKIREFLCKEDELNIAQIASVMKIGAVEFEEKPGNGALRNGRQFRVLSFYQNEPDREQEPAVWLRETFAGTTICFRIWPQKGMTWNESDRYIAEQCVMGFAIIKKSVYLQDGFEYAISHDSAFGSRNLSFGLYQISELIDQGKISGYSVFFMNMKGTGEMNSQIGRSNGTVIMRKFLEKLDSVLEAPEAVWRIGGDNLGAVVLKSKTDKFLELVQGVTVAFGPGEDERYRISATAGVCPGSNEFKKTSEIVDAAQACMNLAKFERHVPYLFYDRQIVGMMENTKHVEMAFPEAIGREEFQVYYQPKVSLQTHEVVGAEALCRWVRDGEVIPPNAFIPVLERSKRICELDFYMLDHACRDIRKWIDQGGRPVEISSNFSRMHLNNPYLAKKIVQTLDKYDIPHELIIVEITETTNSEHLRRLGELVYRLKDEGIRTSVDDFGMGYSSMSMLRDIPFSELKIDRSFLTYTTDNRDRSAIMMKHVISMANELHMQCIAEGVETVDQIKMLKEMQCLRAQGFYFDKPLPKSEFAERLKMGRYGDGL